MPRPAVSGARAVATVVREVVVVSAVEILEAEAAVETLEDSVAAAVAVEPEGRPFFDTRTPPNKPSTAF